VAAPLRHALLGMARRLAPAERTSARADKKAHDAEKLARREEAVQRQLRAAVEKYAEALELFDEWKATTVDARGKPPDVEGLKKALDAALRGKTLPEKLVMLRCWIEMRTRGVGWTQFSSSFSYDADQREENVKAWRKLLLDDIFPHEVQARRRKQLPKAAAPPQLRVRLAKTLGTADPDVLALESASVLNVNKQLARACGGGSAEA
jgi:hypothetical protein